MADAREMLLVGRMLCWDGRYEQARRLLEHLGRGLLEAELGSPDERRVLAIADEGLDGPFQQRDLAVRWDWELDSPGYSWSHMKLMLRAQNPRSEKLVVRQRTVSCRSRSGPWGPGEPEYWRVELDSGESTAIYRELAIRRAEQETLLRAIVSVEGAESGDSRWLSILRIPRVAVAGFPVAATIRVDRR